jgi:hypothetical protein
MRAVSSVPTPKYEVFHSASGASKLCVARNYLFFNALRCLMNEIECACGMGWPVISERVFPISGFRPQLAEFESLQLEPGMTDFGRRR